LLEIPPAIWSVKAWKIYLSLTLVPILCREVECANDVHNKGWYWSLQYSLVEIPPVIWPVKAGQKFSIFSSGGHFVQQSRKCQRCAQLWMILITPVKFGWNPTSSLTCEGLTRFLYFNLWPPFCAGKWNGQWCAQLGMVLITPVKFDWKIVRPVKVGQAEYGQMDNRTTTVHTNVQPNWNKGQTDRQRRQKQYVSQKFWET
jgi:hypothetical protein